MGRWLVPIAPRSASDGPGTAGSPAPAFGEGSGAGAGLYDVRHTGLAEQAEAGPRVISLFQDGVLSSVPFDTTGRFVVH
jgi:hypothetical protein